MFPTRHELLAEFSNPVFTPHSFFTGLRTFSFLENWKSSPVIELPRLRIEIKGLDYLEFSGADGRVFDSQIRFQQDCYRLWYQVDGTGILQNVTRNSFGTARPGLLGVMERGERHTYLHQKGNFECFQVLFSLLPSQQAKCFWNAEVEGKVVLEDREKAYFENLVFDLLMVISKGKEILGLASISRLLEILVVLFKKGLMIVDERQFPKNKVKYLVNKARSFMDLHYSTIQHQQSLEEECGVDVNYLNIIFKKETGMTLYNYMTRVRMEHAKHLLETTDVPVTDIACRVGYPNGNSFSRAFKRQEKCSPQEFRSRLKTMKQK
jgi:AraC-like DNA-binding protein